MLPNRKRSLFVKLIALFLLFYALPLFSQGTTGQLDLKVIGPSGVAVKTIVQITSEANQYQSSLATDASGDLSVQRLPFGIYQIQIHQSGFAVASETIQIQSSIPIKKTIQLQLPSVHQSITVSARATLINPEQPSAVSQIGSKAIQTRLSSIPGRSVQDLVRSQPGWIYEGNAVLHPRGYEYETQFVIDGIPLTDNRSPGFGPALEANNLQSVTIYTAGFPAEYGRKLGGVIVLNTIQNPQPGFHGQVVLSGGSYDSAGSFTQGSYGWGKNTLGFSAGGNMTDHYLNPVVTENYSNRATLGDFSANYQRDLTQNDRLTFLVSHELSRYDLPNEIVQQAAGQRITGYNGETMGIVTYQHIFSAHALANFRAMGRENNLNLNSNPKSTPIEVFQHNWFDEGYFSSDLVVDRGHQEWKAGIESDNKFLNEHFRYDITNPTQFNPSTPGTFAFLGKRPDLEQGAFVQDLIRLGAWTINAGIRWDHYQLVVNQQAFSPRFVIARYFRSAGAILHFSYDRVFNTPSFENLLLSSSTAATKLDAFSLQLPVQPSVGNYYEAGLEKAFFDKIRFDANYYLRSVDNYGDDNQIANTSISFPIAFRKALIYGAEGSVNLPVWGRFSGYLNYSYQLGKAWNPVTGGLFLGAEAAIPTTGYFPDSQDQRNTVEGRLRYQVTPRLWVAGGVQYDSGLPFDFQCRSNLTLAECIAGQAQIYGQDVVNRVNFNRGRIDPTFQVNASVGAQLYKSDHANVEVQVDGENLSNVVDVIDFGGLFSGNAIGPARSFFMRLTTNF